MPGLYIHIPFCKSCCNYCDFYKKRCPDRQMLESYIAALGREMEYRRDFLSDKHINTIFFGGGTPSIYKPEALQRIMDKAATIWDLSGLEEVTVEINPDDATEEYLDELARTNVNRISFGVQSFSDKTLQFLNRRHNAEQAVQAVKTARDKGFGNISIDLMYGIPGMTMKEWDRTLMQALALGVNHISAYHLTIEPGTVFGDMLEEGKLVPVDEEASESQYLLTHQLLTTTSGFDHYEISNYARKPEFRAKHNCNYWMGESQYLGLGPSAHSYDGDQRSYAVSSLDDYLSGAGSDRIYGREILTKVDKYNEFVMISLRTSGGVRRDVMTRRFGVDSMLYFEFAADKFVRQGLLVREDNEYKIPPEKFMISDNIIRELFYEGDE